MERIHEDVQMMMKTVKNQIKINALLKEDKNDKEVCLCIR